jgi:hypothetical protein
VRSARKRSAGSQFVRAQVDESTGIGKARIDPGGILAPIPPHCRLKLAHYGRRIQVDDAVLIHRGALSHWGSESGRRAATIVAGIVAIVVG